MHDKSEWVKHSLVALGEYQKICESFLSGSKPRIDPEAQWVISQLALSCFYTSRSTTVLIESDYVWDADILIRSVVEGSFKLVFMCTTDKAEHERRIKEYWDELPEIAQIKDFQRMEDFFTEAKIPDTSELRTFSRPQTYINNLRRKFPRKERRIIEHKWSLIRIVSELAKENIPNYDRLLKIPFDYGMASHFAHKDGDAILFQEYLLRMPSKKRNVWVLATAARILSDLMILANYRALTIFKLHLVDIQPVMDVYNKHKDLYDELVSTRKVIGQLRVNEKSNK